MPAFGAAINKSRKGKADKRSLKQRNEDQKKQRENNAAASIRLITKGGSSRSFRRASFTRGPKSERENKEKGADADADADQGSWDSNDGIEEYDYYDTALGWILTVMEPVIITLIVANAITMGIGTFDFVTKDPKMEDIFELVDKIFLVIFTVEVFLASFHYLRFDRIIWLGTCSKIPDDDAIADDYVGTSFHGDKLGLGDTRHSQAYKQKSKSYQHHQFVNKNSQYSFLPIAFRPMHSKEKAERKINLPWISFDAIVVILSWSFQSLSIIRAFRILRALRIISKVESMRRVVRGVLAIGPKIGMVAFLLSLLLLVFGIMFTQLYRDLYVEGYAEMDYFGTFFLSLLTLFQIMTFDNWHWIARDAMKRDSWAWVLFVLWVLVSGFVIMNMIIAIVCESLVTMTQDVMAARDAKLKKEAGLDDHSIDGSIATLVDFRVYQMQEMIDETLMDQDELLLYSAHLRKVVRQLLVHDKVTVRNKKKLREAIKKIESKKMKSSGKILKSDSR